MRAVIVGAGMGGLMTALALRQSGVFASVDIYEQTKVPSTAGAGLNIPPNGARICRRLGVDLDGGDPKGPDGVIDGGRAAILESTRQLNADGSVTKRPFDHVTAAGDDPHDGSGGGEGASLLSSTLTAAPKCRAASS